MNFLIGALGYLAAVAIVVAAGLAGVLSVVNHRPQEPPVLAKSTDGRAAGWERQREEDMRVDPNRVPVWIAPTAKYDYTPVPADQAPKRTPVIGEEARGAKAKARTKPESQPDDTARTGMPLRVINSRRDNDPFFRD